MGPDQRVQVVPSSGPAYIRSPGSHRSTHSGGSPLLGSAGTALIVPLARGPNHTQPTRRLVLSWFKNRKFIIHWCSVPETIRRALPPYRRILLSRIHRSYSSSIRCFPKTSSLPRHTCSISTTAQNTLIVFYTTYHKHESQFGTDIGIVIGMV